MQNLIRIMQNGRNPALGSFPLRFLFRFQPVEDTANVVHRHPGGQGRFRLCRGSLPLRRGVPSADRCIQEQPVDQAAQDAEDQAGRLLDIAADLKGRPQPEKAPSPM